MMRKKHHKGENIRKGQEEDGAGESKHRKPWRIDGWVENEIDSVIDNYIGEAQNDWERKKIGAGRHILKMG